MSRHNKFADDSSVISVVVPSELKERITKLSDHHSVKKSDMIRSMLFFACSSRPFAINTEGANAVK
jgi:hypothetical protein